MIYLIITTSINNRYGIKNNKHREERYVNSISSALNIISNAPYNIIKPIIVENNGHRITYLDNFNCDVTYTNNNQYLFPHKGQNELLDIQHVINQYNIQDDDLIIKLTGRYTIFDNSFFNLIMNNINNFDAFIKFFNVCTKQYMHNDCALGLIAVKSKYLKQFQYNFIKSAECEFADFIRTHIENDRIMEVKELNLEYCFGDTHELLII